ncbi:hypothetical protein GGR51DRAFT_568558 [Nemania sp. FL0031]|nr:hypothetical protein GGR51DRAFT_568558 [Nemania sp. FL0031]
MGNSRGGIWLTLPEEVLEVPEYWFQYFEKQNSRLLKTSAAPKASLKKTSAAPKTARVVLPNSDDVETISSNNSTTSSGDTETDLDRQAPLTGSKRIIQDNRKYHPSRRVLTREAYPLWKPGNLTLKTDDCVALTTHQHYLGSKIVVLLLIESERQTGTGCLGGWNMTGFWCPVVSYRQETQQLCWDIGVFRTIPQRKVYKRFKRSALRNGASS